MSSRRLGFVLGLWAFLNGCGGNNPPPIPCPPFCVVTQTPVPVPSGTPSPAESASPVRSPTATATRVPPSPSPVVGTVTPTPRVPTKFGPFTSGVLIFRFKLAQFSPKPRNVPAKDLLDYYTGTSGMYGAGDRHAPAFEISLRGYDPEPCLSSPCGSLTEGPDRIPVGPHPMGAVLRVSGDIAADGEDIDPNTPQVQLKPEEEMCGEGIGYSQRLPIGFPDQFGNVEIRLAYNRDGWMLITPVARRTLTQGAPRIGVGEVWFPYPAANGIPGWGREPWSMQKHGGAVELVEVIGALNQFPLGACPGP